MKTTTISLLTFFFTLILSSCTLLIPVEEAPQTCGDGTVDPWEDCEPENVDGKTCVSLGFTGGVLTCAHNCVFDTSNCTNNQQCGNGTVDAGEKCDGNDLGDAIDCQSLDLGSGDLLCQENCTYDTSQCEFQDSCGNGAIDHEEECDGDNLNSKSCLDLGFAGGDLDCFVDNCTYDTSGCLDNSFCGNGIAEDGEECDGSTLPNGDSLGTCEEWGFCQVGAVGCNSDCTLDFGVCGDTCNGSGTGVGMVCDVGNSLSCTGFNGQIEVECSDFSGVFKQPICTMECNTEGPDVCVGSGGECVETGMGSAYCAIPCEADGALCPPEVGTGDFICSNFMLTGLLICVPPEAPLCGNGDINPGEECDGSNLNNYDCTNLGYRPDGVLSCNPDCTFNITNCEAYGMCGDDVAQPAYEECDGSDLNGATCQNQGYASGTLDCTSSCTFDYSGCSN